MAIKTHSGRLKFAVDFKQPTSSLNDEGGEEKTFVVAFSTKADMQNLKRQRAVDADTTVSIEAVEFTVRWCDNTTAVTGDWLINRDGIDHTIVDIDDLTYFKEYISFTAKARTNG
jgi:SPP1 family predicted phage head-tail adaptor